jgi:hypothetical protein
MPAIRPPDPRRTHGEQARPVTSTRRQQLLRELRRPRAWALAGIVLVLVFSVVKATSGFVRSGNGEAGGPAWTLPAPLASGSESVSPSAGTASPSRSTSPSPRHTERLGASPPPPAEYSRGRCALPKYPTPRCTGVPAGTVLKTLALNLDNDAYAVYKAGAVIDSKHIPGHLLIKAPNVTVKNSQIDGTVMNEFGGRYNPYTITDSTVGPATGCITAPGLGYAHYTAKGVRVRGHDDGFRVDAPGDVRIEDSYAKLCWNPPALAPPDGSHSGGIQVDCPTPCGRIVFSHNTVDNRQPNANSGITMQSFAGNIVHGPVTISHNLVGGGGYVMWPWWYDPAGPEIKYEIHNNRVINKSWAYAPVDANGSCAHQNWSGNTLVTVDADYNITSTVGPLSCIQ